MRGDVCSAGVRTRDGSGRGGRLGPRRFRCGRGARRRYGRPRRGGLALVGCRGIGIPGCRGILRAPPVPSATPGSAERVAACRDVDIARLVGEPVDVSVDPDLADGADTDAPDTVAVPAGVASCDDELKPDGAVALVDDEDPGADDLDAADEDEPESEGSADATQGVAASPAPMPSATANPPIRPIYLAHAISDSSATTAADKREILRMRRAPCGYCSNSSSRLIENSNTSRDRGGKFGHTPETNFSMPIALAVRRIPVIDFRRAGRAGTDHSREVDHPPTDALPQRTPAIPPCRTS